MKTNKTIAAFFAVVFISGWLNVLLGSEIHNLATNTTNQSPQPALMVCDNPGMLSITENDSNMHLPTTSNRNNTRSTWHDAIVEGAVTNVFTNITTSGNAQWTVVTDNTAHSSNKLVARSGSITHNQNSRLTATLEVESAGSVSFWWKVSSEANFDRLTFKLTRSTGSLLAEKSISGNVGWHEKTIDIPNGGTFTLEWTYSKDGSVTHGQDRGWVDKLSFNYIKAEDIVKFRPAFAIANQEVTIEMEILDSTILHNFDFVAFNADIVLEMKKGTDTEEFEYVNTSAELIRYATDPNNPDEKLHKLGAVSTTIAGVNTLRLISWAEPTTAYPSPKNGVIVSFKLTVPSGIASGTWTFDVKNIVIADAAGENLLASDKRETTGSIEILGSCVVTFNVEDYREEGVGNATITITDLNDPPTFGATLTPTTAVGTASTTIPAGIYKFTIEHDCYPTHTGDLTVNNTNVIKHITLAHMPGDANGNGTVNVTDITTIINHFLDQSTPAPCPVNADANEDGEINVQDVVVTMNIIFGPPNKTSLYEGMQSKKAQGYLNPNGIYIESDGTLTAMQFYIEGNNLETLSMASALLSHQIMYRVEGNELVAMLFSLNNTPIPEGKVRIIDFEQGNNQLQWGEALAANLIGDPVPVITYTDQPTDVEEPDGFENILVYPNPANDVLWVELVNSPETPVSVSLINIHGQLILSHTIKEMGATKTAMNIAQLPAGTYMLRLETAYTSTTKKIIIK